MKNSPEYTEEKEIILASPRGFCAGVHRAISTVEHALKKYQPLYVYHQIVHNNYVVSSLQKKGVLFREKLEEIPDGSVTIFSAHGVPPKDVQLAQKKNLKIIDATCPLVTKVHREAINYAKNGCEIVYIGHKKHIETIGTVGEAPEKIHVVESVEDISDLKIFSDQVAYLCQTTLAVSETASIIEKLKEKYPKLIGPSKSDICYATTNRQNAVNTIAPLSDVIFVIGSKNSSNSNRLKEVAEKHNKPSYLIEDANSIKKSWLSDDTYKVGITAGASAPEILVEGVIRKLKEEYGYKKIHEINTIEEEFSFSLPSI